MTWSNWYVPPFFTSIFFVLGVITLYWSFFTWVTRNLQNRRKQLDLKKAQAILGILCAVVLIFSIQLLVRDSPLSWAFTNFQLLILIFIAYFLQVWLPYWGIILAGIAFMLMNGNIDQPLSWFYTVVYGSFYAVSYLQSVRMWPRPFLRYLVTAVAFGLPLWAIVYLRFHLSWQTIAEEMISYLVLATLMYGFFMIQNRDQRIKDRLFQAANWDALTHVKNYAAFDREISYQFQHCVSHHRHLTMIMFDIDHFKHINDTYGHLAGDEVLKALGKDVSTLLRQYGTGVTLFRTGGEEFNVVLPNVKLAQAQEIAQAIFDAVAEQKVTYNEATIQITLSMGVSELNAEDGSPLALYKRVDSNLYQSKKNGRMQITADVR
ncbi:MAG TPA: GGDEF domain-containing protein [Candidatus Levilactobacillus faecigallinarum]|uniref:GGDEF domain-containing protein n=1 Tax=Candidatus Levilactobacillus faecigallinarum TaxID=2838638 RepID=A0A9D1U440_9LACO|nr:GGDEF domain-containing protein [Candidatus Levilactobacillus faecigallinarum]